MLPSPTSKSKGPQPQRIQLRLSATAHGTPSLENYSSSEEPAEGFPNLQLFFLSPAPLHLVSPGPSLALPLNADAAAASAQLLVQVRIFAVEVALLALVEALRLALLVQFLLEIRVSSVELPGPALLVMGLFEHRACPVEVLHIALLLVS